MLLPDTGLREFGSIVPGGEVPVPDTAQPLPRAAVFAAEKDLPAAAPPIFAADKAGEADRLDLARPVAVLAALAVHARTETPLAIGLLGRPGTGKSSALRMLVRAIEAASGAVRGRSGAGTLGKISVVEIDATRLEGAPVVAFADLLHASLADSYPAFVGEALHASRDPRLAAREALETLDAARRKLSVQRQALESEEARRAGLAESVLFETAGTQIDVYVRANRTRLKNRLAGLGIEGEPIRAFKQLVHRIMDGTAGKLGFLLRSFWAFKGQGKLVVLAVVLLLVGIGLGYADAERSTWLGRLREIDSTRAVADWLEAHIDLVDTLRRVLFIGAGLAIATNLVRALRLVLPVFRASTLLADDLSRRRRQADEEFGHEIRRVESLAAEVDALARRAAEAERRAAEERPGTSALAEVSPFLDDPKKRQAERFIAAVGRLVEHAGRPRAEPKVRPIDVPGRIVIALDNLDALDPSRARDILAAAHAVFGNGFVMLAAIDPGLLKSAAVGPGLDAWIQVPFQVGEFSARSDLAVLVRAMLDPKNVESPSAAGSLELPVDLDMPITDPEAQLLVELAPLAGASPRAVKRFVNLYRLACRLCPEHKGMLALLLALDAGGTEAEMEAVAEALGSDKSALDLDHLGVGPRLAAALVSVRSHMGDESLTGARRAAETARLFSFKSSR